MSNNEKKHCKEKEDEKQFEEASAQENVVDEIDGMTESEAKESLKNANAQINTLKEEIEKLKKENEEAKNDYLRARADCENVRKRKGEELKSAYDEGRTVTVEKILPIGDSLDWALKMPLDDNTKDGIEKLLKKYHETLEGLGVVEFSPEIGSKFDPNTANAVMTAAKESEEEELETIKQVYGRGYKLGDKVIRYAQVSVIK